MRKNRRSDDYSDSEKTVVELVVICAICFLLCLLVFWPVMFPPIPGA